MRSHATTALGFLVGVLVATAATATAAIVITGANVKNNSLTGADIKNGSLSSTDLSAASLAKLRAAGAAGPKGDAGAAGPAGAKGDTGATGAKGDTGNTGTTGNTGATGTYPTVLPSGQTMRGVWGMRDNNQTEFGRGYDGVDFPMPLPAGVLADVVPKNSTTANCTGTVLEPTAAAGRMCVYVGGFSTNGASYDVFPPDGGNGNTDETGKYGMIVSSSSNDTDTATYGSWAVKAP